MEFTFPPPANIHTIDIDDAQDPSVLREEITETGTTPATEPPMDTKATAYTAPQEVQDDFVDDYDDDDFASDKGDTPPTYNDNAQAELSSDDESDEESEEESGDESEDDSEDSSDEDSDSSDDDNSTTSAASEKERSRGFEYTEVIDDTSKAVPADPPCDDDLGGEAIAAASTVAGVTALSSMRLRRNLIIGVILAALGAVALYYVWRKIQDMKKKIAQLEQQQEMGLNDRDVQCISTQVLQDYLKQTAVADDNAAADDGDDGDDDTVAAGWTVDEEHTEDDDGGDCTADEAPTTTHQPDVPDLTVESSRSNLDTITEATSETSDTPDDEPEGVPDQPDHMTDEQNPVDDDAEKVQPGSHEDRPADDSSEVVQTTDDAETPEPPLSGDVTETKQTPRRRSRREKKKYQGVSLSK